MKPFQLFFLVSTIATLFFTGCEANNNNDSNTPPAAVAESFNAQYPNATDEEWENEGAYENVQFKMNGMEYEAWFSVSGEWIAANIDMPLTAFPETVRNGFYNSTYSNWATKDTEVFERKNQTTLYLIEVEDGTDNEVTLFFDKSGTLLKTETDGWIPGGNPANLPSEVKTTLNTRYPQAVVIDTEKQTNGTLEVDIIDNNLVKEVLFSAANKWISTSWEVSEAQTPQVVLNVLSGAAYTGFSIDSIEFIETPSQTDGYYHIELEKPGSLDLFVNVKPNGDILLN